MVYKTPVVTDEQYMLSAIVSYVLPVVVMVAALAFLTVICLRRWAEAAARAGIGAWAKLTPRCMCKRPALLSGMWLVRTRPRRVWRRSLIFSITKVSTPRSALSCQRSAVGGPSRHRKDPFG